jgi:hypothetical protein
MIKWLFKHLETMKTIETKKEYTAITNRIEELLPPVS